MKHEQLAQAMTLLDDDLLEEARLAAPRKKVIPWPRWAAAAAACLALVLTLRLWPADGTLFSCGVSVGTEPIPVSDDIAPQSFLERSVSEPLSLSLELKLRRESTIRVSAGTLQLLSGDAQPSEGTELFGSGRLSLEWTIEDAHPGECYRMTAGESVYLLVYDSSCGSWTIFEQKGEQTP